MKALAGALLAQARSAAASRWLPCSLVVLLPAAALGGVRSLVNQTGGLDPYIYTSLIFGFRDVVERYGSAYYTLRLSHILPASLAVHILGPVAGYLAYRALLLAVLAGCAWWLAVQLETGRALATAATVWLVANPTVLRALLWDNPDGSGLTYMFATSVLVLLAARRALDGQPTVWPAAASGLAYCLAVNSYPMIGLLQFGLFAAALLALILRGTALRRVLGWGTCSVAGFGAGYLILVLTRRALVPSLPFHWDPFALSVVGDIGYEIWWAGGVVAYLREGNLAPLVPALFTLAAWLAAWRTRLFRAPRDWSVGELTAVACLGYAIYVLAVYLALDRIWKMSVIRMHFHLIYSVPALYSVVVVLISRLAREWSAARRSLVAASIAAGVLALHAGGVQGHKLLDHVPLPVYVAVAGLLLLAAALASGGGRTLPSVALAAALVLVPAAQLRGPSDIGYRRIYLDINRIEWDVYLSAVALKRAVMAVPPAAGRVGFWYAIDHTYLHSIQSMYLWGYSHITDGRVDRRGMPYLEPDFVAALPQYRYVCLLSESLTELSIGRHAFLALRPGARSIVRGGRTGRKYSAYFELFDTRPE